MAYKSNKAIRRSLKSALIALAALTLATVLVLRPMSVNMLEFLVWDMVGNADSVSGHVLDKGAYVHYRTYGGGFPVLLLRGDSNDLRPWSAQIPWLVATGHRVVTVDSREAEKAPGASAQTDADILAANAVQVLDKLNIHRSDVIGWGDGAIAALELAGAVPARVGRVVAISGNPQGGQEQDWQERLLDTAYCFWTSHYVSRTDLASTLRALLQNGRAVAAPTLVIADEAELDNMQHAGEFARALPAGQLQNLPGAGLAAPVTHARQVDELIAAFLGIEMS